MPHRLYRVGVKEDTARAAARRDLPNGLDGPHFIVGILDGQQGGTAVQRALHLLQREDALPIRAQKHCTAAERLH